MTANISISNLAPKTQRLRWPTVIGLTEITLTNHEAYPLRLRIEGQDIQERCHFEFQLPHEAVYWARQVEFTVPAGQVSGCRVGHQPAIPRLIFGDDWGHRLKLSIRGTC